MYEYLAMKVEDDEVSELNRKFKEGWEPFLLSGMPGATGSSFGLSPCCMVILRRPLTLSEGS